MNLNELLLAELEREAPATRRMLERVPENRADWKPHPRSMPLGYLANMLAAMPAWAAMMVTTDELDATKSHETPFHPGNATSGQELVEAHDRALGQARETLLNTTEEHLMKPWKFVVAGRVASEQPRWVMVQDAVINHLAHHRGQLSVYLRLLEVPVPCVYGPTADEGVFG